MTRISKESILLKTSSASDVQNGGGKLTITGLRSVRKKDITSISQIKYRAAVAQVVNVGTSSYTPELSTAYTVYIGDPNRTGNGGYQEELSKFSYTTPSSWPATLTTDALRREYIHGKLVTAINLASSKIHATAASLLLGTGFSVTDNSDYYPVFSQTMTNMKFANVVLPVTNADGSGFSSTDYTVATEPVASYGVGSKLASEKPVADLKFGSLVSGVLEAPPLATDGTAATSGQNYDGFVINSLLGVSIPTVTDIIGYVDSIKTVYVDNGTGTSTTNLSGFLAFEREMRKEIALVYKNDTNAWIEFYDSPTIFQGAAGAVPTTTGENKIATDYGQFIYNQIGTQTITTPTPGNTGLNLDQDLTATEGAEYSPSLLTNNSQSFIVGKEEFTFVYKTVCADHTDANLYVGFRKKAAHAADFNNYTDLAAIGFLGDLVYTWGILNNAATVATNTTVVPTDAAYEEYVVHVDIEGTVTVKRNGVEYPVYSAGTTALVLDTDDEMIPFFIDTNIGGGDPDLVVSHSIATSGLSWLS